jgi:hypothetical protein
MFRDRFWVSLLLTLPVLIWSPDLQMWLGYEAPTFPGSDLIPAVLGTIVLYGGGVFIAGALPELRDRQPGMMTLISMAIVVAFVTSWAATLGLFEVEIWWELATLITIMLLGTGSRCARSPRRAARSRPWPTCCRTRPSASPAIPRSWCPSHPWPWATWSSCDPGAASRSTGSWKKARPTWTSR